MNRNEPASNHLTHEQRIRLATIAIHEAIKKGHDANDREDCAPPEIRDELLKQHGLAMALVNHGDKEKAKELFDLATDLQDQVQDMRREIDEIEETLDGLCNLYPESLSNESREKLMNTLFTQPIRKPTSAAACDRAS